MIRDVFLYGEAGRRFGKRFRLDVASPAEAVRALMSLRPGFAAFLRAGAWRVIVGPPRARFGIAAEALGMDMGNQPLHLVPVTRPRGDDAGSIGKIIIGTIIIVAAIVLSGGTLAAPLAALGESVVVGGVSLGITYGSIALLGVSMILAGVAGALQGGPAKGTDPGDRSRSEDRPSFLFNGVVNNSQQGAPVPLVYGEHLVGSVVVSAGLAVEDIAV